MKEDMVRTTYVIRKSARDKLLFAKRALGIKMSEILSDALDQYLDQVIKDKIDIEISKLKQMKKNF